MAKEKKECEICGAKVLNLKTHQKSKSCKKPTPKVDYREEALIQEVDIHTTALEVYRFVKNIEAHDVVELTDVITI